MLLVKMLLVKMLLVHSNLIKICSKNSIAYKQNKIKRWEEVLCN